MADDLSAPLGLTAKPRPWRRLPFGLVGGAILGLIAVVFGVWLAFVRDPSGGEPTRVVKIDRSRTGIGATDVAVIGADTPTTAAAHPPAAGHVEAAPAEAGHGEAGLTEAKPTGEKALEPVPPAPRRVVEIAEGQPLSTTPVQRVAEKGRYGTLPRIASDGSRPLEVYGRPAPRRAMSLPRVVLIVGGLGISQTGTQEALSALAPEVTLAFAPYGASLDRWMTRARTDGHELLLQIPMEPFDYPDNDPGPHTLIGSAGVDVNLDRLAWLMARLTNYVGIINHMGAKFTANDAALGTVMKEIAGRGLLYVDDGSSSRSTADSVARAAGAAFERGDVVIDAVPSEDAITARLAQLEQIARAKGVAVGTASALPITLRKLQAWIKGLDGRGLVLVPATAIARDGQG